MFSHKQSQNSPSKVKISAHFHWPTNYSQ